MKLQFIFSTLQHFIFSNIFYIRTFIRFKINFRGKFAVSAGEPEVMIIREKLVSSRKKKWRESVTKLANRWMISIWQQFLETSLRRKKVQLLSS